MYSELSQFSSDIQYRFFKVCKFMNIPPVLERSHGEIPKEVKAKPPSISAYTASNKRPVHEPADDFGPSLSTTHSDSRAEEGRIAIAEPSTDESREQNK